MPASTKIVPVILALFAVACGTGVNNPSSSNSPAEVKYAWEPGNMCVGLLTIGEFPPQYECHIQVVDPVLGPRPLRLMPLRTDVKWTDSSGLDGTSGTTETIRLTKGGGIIEVMALETAGRYSIVPSSWISVTLEPRTATAPAGAGGAPDKIRIDFGQGRGVLVVSAESDSQAWYWRLGPRSEVHGPFTTQSEAVQDARSKCGFQWPANIVKSLEQSGVRLDDGT